MAGEATTRPCSSTLTCYARFMSNKHFLARSPFELAKISGSTERGELKPRGGKRALVR